MEILSTLKESPETLKSWYTRRWHMAKRHGKVAAYEKIKAAYNSHPNGADLVFLSGAVTAGWSASGVPTVACPRRAASTSRFLPKFLKRVDQWHERIVGTQFAAMDFEDAMNRAKAAAWSTAIRPTVSLRDLYGRSLGLDRLFAAIARCKQRGVFVALRFDEAEVG